MKRSLGKIILPFFGGLLLFACPAFCYNNYYVATNGSDSNPGDFDHPFLTIYKGYTTAVAGDYIYVRGGTYAYSGTSNAITLPSKSGSSPTNRCHLFAYPGERPVLDFNAMPDGGSDGLKINGSYWHVKGFDCIGAPHNGIKISGGSYNIVEFCRSFRNRNSGVQLGGGAAFNQIINCDSFYNFDAPDGGDADGFSPKLDVGQGNYFYGCRSWQNSDDGYDGYLRGADDINTFYTNCWAFKNGYLENGSPSTGNGNGFKMGGGDNSNSLNLKHNVIYKNCLCFNNRIKGFDQNNDRGSMWLFNCTSFENGTYNYSITGPIVSGKTAIVENCVSYYDDGTGAFNLGSYVSKITNSSGFTVTGGTFLSTDPTECYGVRKADGSLPDVNFMRLAGGSVLIDQGTIVAGDANYCGSKPDIGCFENCISGPPYQAGSPNPADLAINIYLTSSLSWSAGPGATSHDVYFGTSATPPFIGNQTSTTYGPLTLSPSTTYYWHIDEKNESGTTAGSLWSFTTVPPLPGIATDPNPGNMATEVNRISFLTWTAGAGAISHDVYFGTVMTPTFIHNNLTALFNPGPMMSSTTYYWRVDERNASGAVTGTLWSFTTEDTLPPQPNPMSWILYPESTSATQISMTAATAADVSGVEYYFANVTDPAHDSNWQDSPVYVDTNLMPNGGYYYQVKARDKSMNHNETDWTEMQGALTLPYDCSASPIADFDGSCEVDLYDYALFADAWANEIPQADLNNDTYFDYSDFAQFAQEWLNCNRYPESACWQQY